MRRQWRLYLFLGFMFALYVTLKYYEPKPLSWKATFHPQDKSPYGGYIVFDRIGDVFSGDVFTGDSTLYELQDSKGPVLILTTQANMAEGDITLLLERVSGGADVLLAAEQFSSDFTDTLDINTRRGQIFNLPNQTDTTDVTIGDTTARLSDVLVQTHFDLSSKSPWKVLASTDKPILISQEIGQGTLILSSTPLAFTNFGILQDHRLAEYALNLLPDEDLHYTYFYHMGKLRSTSPFRYVLTEVSLTWALYIALATVLCLLIIDAQRRQRKVKVLLPPQNTTVNFVKTIGALFYRERDHKKIASKMAHYFQEELNKKYHKPPTFTERYYEWLANKTGLEKTHVIQTFQQIQQLPSYLHYSEKQLNQLNDRISRFPLQDHQTF